MHRGIAVAAAVIVLYAPGSGVLASGGPQITDIAGDANGLPVSQDTRPASYDPADILAVTMSTDYVAVPVGGDGIDYQERALLIRFDTFGSPVPDAGTLAFGVGADLGACQSSFGGYVSGPIGNTGDGTGGTVRWVQFGECPDLEPDEFSVLGFGTAVDHPQWTATADPAARTVTLRIPFASLTEGQAAFLRPGARIASPSAQSWMSRSVYVVSDAGARAALAFFDATDTGSDFTIGEDVPPDVPCTQGCP